MNETEERGYAWLIRERGYQAADIVFQPRRSPDFLTRDGKGWEIKKVRNGTVTFFPAQLIALANHPDVTVLIFNGGDGPDGVLPFSQLTVPGYESGYRLVVANRDPDSTLFLVRFPLDLFKSLQRAAAENDRTVTGEIVHRLRQSIRADERKVDRER